MFENVYHISSGRFVSQEPWQHPERIIASHEILFVIQGTVYIIENGKEYTLNQNDVLFLESHSPHSGFRASRNVSFYWLHWEGELPPILPKQQAIESAFHLSLLFRQLLHYAVGNESEECLHYLTRLILAEVTKNTSHTSNKTASRVAAWIKANRHLPLKVADVARQFGYNADYLNRLFQKHFGKSTKHYIDEMRLYLIKEQLLNNDLPLAELAFTCGFADYKSFLKFFKYHEGITPTEFCGVYAKIKLNTK